MRRVWLGNVSNYVSNPPYRTYSVDWSNALAGSWSLGAGAVRTNGTPVSVSATPVLITVRNGYSLSVDITHPTNGASYPAPTNISLVADVQASNANPAFVEFFDNSSLLAIVSNSISAGPMPGGVYLFEWTNPPPGPHTLTASVTDTNRVVAWSSPVMITIGTDSFSIFITSPTDGAAFTQPVNVPIDASVLDAGKDVAFVNFTATRVWPPGIMAPTYLIELGAVSNWVSIAPPRHDYLVVWSNAPVGSWRVAAEAVRSNGLPEGGASVQFTVLGNTTNTNNLPPVLRITSPPNQSDFRAPMNIVLLAYAFDPDGWVSSVEFFAGSNSLGLGHPIPSPISPGPIFPANPYPMPPIYLSNLFELIWTNPAPGAYAVTAVATDNGGLTATSAPVNITVEPAPPPPTNRPAVVGIVASDPIAIEGTNCWPWLGGPPTWSNWMSPTAVWRWFTNCGPKDASFTLFRRGDTNHDLTVNYAIGGTASNGVDYVTLPGNVTIPAGQTAATIAVIPIDDGTPDISSTVVLALQADTNTPADYALGFPCRAEVIIIDSFGPRRLPPGSVLPDGSFHLSLTGPDGAWFHIDGSTDLLNWTPLCTNQVVNGAIDFLDPDAGLFSSRMYRAVPMASSPGN